MLNRVGSPLKLENRFAGTGLFDKSLRCQARRPESLVRILSWSPSPQASGFSSQRVAINDGEMPRVSTVVQQAPKVGSIRGRSPKTPARVASISSPGFLMFPDAGHDVYVKRTQNGAATSSRSGRVEVSAKGKWRKVHDSSLSEDEPLPLPMTWPNSEPVPAEKVNEMLKCDPEKQSCKDVIYQWTGDCKRCQGTGLVSFYRKKREVVSKCVNCLGMGSVHKITSRADIQGMDGVGGDFNGSARGSPGTNGRP